MNRKEQRPTRAFVYFKENAMKMPWTQVSYTKMGSIAIKHIEQNTESFGLKYHNMEHIASMYEYLESTNEPYDYHLDIAVLFHDAVYDKDPNKELRSVKFYKNACYDNSTDPVTLVRFAPVVEEMIVATIDHTVTAPYLSAIIRADVAALRDKVQAWKNHAKIIEESCNLYNITEREAAQGSWKFMAGFRARILSNTLNDPLHTDFWLDVVRGIDFTIELNKLILS